MKKAILYVVTIAISSFFALCFTNCDAKKREHLKKEMSPPTVKTKSLPQPVINVYVENSGSMNGYMHLNSGFKEIVYNYLADIKIAKLTNSLNLFYINSQIISQGNNIEDFIQKLSPNTFTIIGGDIATSDMANLFKTLTQRTNDTTVSIFISDCIISPGRGNDAADFLANQEIGIKITFAEALGNTPTLSVIAYRCLSLFTGKYFDRKDHFVSLKNQPRPFFIWLMGRKEYLQQLTSAIPDSQFKGKGVQHKFTLTDSCSVDYALQQGSGKFTLNKQHPKTHIEELNQTPQSGEYTFAVQAKLDHFLLDESYLTNPANYEMSDPRFQIQITRANPNPHGYTHRLRFSTSQPASTTLTVRLKKKLPAWIDEQTDYNGEGLAQGAKEKTYGLKSIMEGIHGAYIRQNNNYYTEIKISINQ